MPALPEYDARGEQRFILSREAGEGDRPQGGGGGLPAGMIAKQLPAARAPFSDGTVCTGIAPGPVFEG